MPSRPWAAACAAALAVTAIVAPVSAQDVRLRSFDGTVEIEGNLLAYDGAYYQLDTVYGPLTVSAEGVACDGPGCPDLLSFVAEARIAGASTVAEGLLPSLIAAFARQQDMGLDRSERADGTTLYDLVRQDGAVAARFFVTSGTTEDGFRLLADGAVDIALAEREPNEQERLAARDGAPDDPPLTRRVRVLALDALVPVVSDDNPILALSMSELARVYTGEIDNWASLGGADAPIARHLLAPGLGPAQDFASRLSAEASRPLAQNVIRHATASDLARAIAGDAFAIGVTTRSSAGRARALPLTGSCGFSQTASVSAIKAEDYPLTAAVYLYLAPYRLPQLVRQFLAFTETAEAERTVRAAGYVDQRIEATPLALQGERLGNAIRAAGDEVALEDLQLMLDSLGHAARLSTTFRFSDGSTELDPQSRAAAARLASEIERGELDGRTLLFVGFSDSAGSAEVNRRIAERRAESVRDEVAARAEAGAARVALETEAFGEALPMACEDTDWGRAVNRRVEVWLR